MIGGKRRAGRDTAVPPAFLIFILRPLNRTVVILEGRAESRTRLGESLVVIIGNEHGNCFYGLRHLRLQLAARKRCRKFVLHIFERRADSYCFVHLAVAARLVDEPARIYDELCKHIVPFFNAVIGNRL